MLILAIHAVLIISVSYKANSVDTLFFVKQTLPLQFILLGSTMYLLNSIDMFEYYQTLDMFKYSLIYLSRMHEIY